VLKTRIIKRLQETAKNDCLFEKLGDACVLPTMRVGNWSVELFEHEIIDVGIIPVTLE
jgi:hypothetical protein